MIRDQQPLSEAKLARCLTGGLQVADWLRLINSMVFFWVDPEQLARLRQARAYRATRQLVLVLDTSEVAHAYGDRIFLTDRNTGATSPFAAPRGRDTFVPLRSDSRRRIVEVVLQDGVPESPTLRRDSHGRGRRRSPDRSVHSLICSPGWRCQSTACSCWFEAAARGPQLMADCLGGPAAALRMTGVVDPTRRHQRAELLQKNWGKFPAGCRGPTTVPASV